MATRAYPERYYIRTLKNPPILLADESAECAAVKELLERSGIQVEIIEGTLRPHQRRPLLLHNGATYQGFEQIHQCLAWLEYQSRQTASYLFA